jgi:hypothetical protein
MGETPPVPNAEDSSGKLRRKVLRDMQRHLPAGNPFSALRLKELPSDPDALNAIADRIETAFAQSYRDPQTVPEGALREIKSEDHAGHRISTFVGRDSFIASMGQPLSQSCRGRGEAETDC